jgi:hypothetical protein
MRLELPAKSFMAVLYAVAMSGLLALTAPIATLCDHLNEVKHRHFARAVNEAG